MIALLVTGRDGRQRTVFARLGASLMEALRDANVGVEGTCGGICACGTCHVYVDAAWAARLPPQGVEEADMLAAIGDVAEVRRHSRLACQIELKDELSGLAVEIGPLL